MAGQQQAGGGIVLSDELSQQLDFMLGKGQLLMAMDRPSEEELAERKQWLADVRKKRAEGTLTTTEAQAIVQKFFKAVDKVICNLLIGNCENLTSEERTKQALAALNKSLEEGEESAMEEEFLKEDNSEHIGGIVRVSQILTEMF